MKFAVCGADRSQRRAFTDGADAGRIDIGNYGHSAAEEIEPHLGRDR